MRDIWVISDTHFSHGNSIFKWDNGRKEFSSIEEMDELMVQNWNSVVKPGDLVYHLGDVYFGSLERYRDVIHPRLNGSKRLLVGNHDDIKQIASANLFQKIMMWRMFPEFGILMTHVPVHESTLEFKDLINVHGHVHNNSLDDPRYVNMSVEVINYTPVNIEELRKK